MNLKVGGAKTVKTLKFEKWGGMVHAPPPAPMEYCFETSMFRRTQGCGYKKDDLDVLNEYL